MSRSDLHVVSKNTPLLKETLYWVVIRQSAVKFSPPLYRTLALNE